MKMIAAVPVALLTFGVLGCSQQANTAPAVVQPPAQSTTSDKNMFGESKDEAAGSAANARAAAYGGDHTPADAAGTAAAGSTPAK